MIKAFFASNFHYKHLKFFNENKTEFLSPLPGSKSAVIALIAGSTTKGMRKRKAKTERIAVVPMEIRKHFRDLAIETSVKSSHPNQQMCTISLSPNKQR